MARMYDTSLMPNQFSLYKLSEIYHDNLIKTRKYYLDYFKKMNINDPNFIKSLETYEKFNEGMLKKIDMKTFFQFKKTLATGEEGKSYVMPEIEELHTSPKYIADWIKYSVLDAEVTFYLRDSLQLLLKSLSCKTTTHINPVINKMTNNYDLYINYWRPFGELMTDMEKEGIKIDVDYLKKIQGDAETDLKLHENKFIKWVLSEQPEALEFNPSSTQQLIQLLYGPCFRNISQEKATKINSRISSKLSELIEDSLDELEEDTEDDTKTKTTPKGKLLQVLPKERIFKVDNIYGICREGKEAPLKKRDMKITGLGFTPLGYTLGGLPAIDQNIVKKMLIKEPNGKSLAYNQHFDKFKNEKRAQDFEEGLFSYEKFKNIETLLKTFIIPLQTSSDKNGRIHCSLNFNTDTGRISARRPNLQNQPAHDKDKYKIRWAFQAEKGKKLIVADYGQLELRILANITNCKSMIEAFKLGGDFHSRTALSMFPEIQDSINKGECVLEWDNSKGKCPVPLLKDKFAGLRKKAKTMNFSIAYGKSAHGFSKDWLCSIDEAEETVKKWYSNRKEAEQWQIDVKQLAVDKAYTQTLIGRYRNLRKIISEGKTFNHALRAAINTPIQGGAADVVIAGMIKLMNNQELKDLGYKILLQIHDEVILEGPEESATYALELVKKDMEDPFNYKFPIQLEVDAKIGNNWYESK